MANDSSPTIFSRRFMAGSPKRMAQKLKLQQERAVNAQPETMASGKDRDLGP
jgi:hypothetical protein